VLHVRAVLIRRFMASIASIALAVLSGSAVGCWSLTADVPDLSSGVGRALPDGGDFGDGAAGDPDGAGARDGSATFCASLGRVPTLCDDFDEGPLGAKWSASVNTQLGGTIVLGPSADGSPHALFVRGASGQPDSPTAQLVHVLPLTPRRLEVSFDLDVETAASSPGHILAGLALQTSQGDYRVDLTFLGDRLAILQSNAPNYSADAPLPFGQWVHVAMTVELADPSTVVVDVDGAHAIQRALQHDPLTPGVRLDFGHYEGPPYPTEDVASFRFDNLVWDATPN
jgi:hypothetical protein